MKKFVTLAPLPAPAAPEMSGFMFSPMDLLTIRDVTRHTRLSRPTIYRYMHTIGFPRPLKMSSGAVRWRAGEVARWLGEQERANYGGT